MKVIITKLSQPFSFQRFRNALALFSASFLVTGFSFLHSALAQIDMSVAQDVPASASVSSTGSVGTAAATLGDVMCNVADNMTPFIDVFNMVAYVAAAIFLIQGLLHLHHHYESAREHPHHKTFALFLAGSLLGILPSVVATLTTTLFNYDGDGGSLTDCSNAAGPATVSAVSGSGLDAMMANFVNDISSPITGLVSIVAVLMGLFLIMRGLIKASRYGLDPRTHSITHILVNLIIGSILIATSQGVDALMGSLFGSTEISAFSSLQWTAFNGLGDTTQFKAAMQAALTFFQLVGLISFVRGWNVLRHAVEGVGQATYAQGMTHIIGGVMAMNIYMFMQIMDHTFGTNFVT